MTRSGRGILRDSHMYTRDKSVRKRYLLTYLPYAIFVPFSGASKEYIPRQCPVYTDDLKNGKRTKRSLWKESDETSKHS